MKKIYANRLYFEFVLRLYVHYYSDGFVILYEHTVCTCILPPE
jgi:hypothetical protein